jgi:GH24 family phage-related lysozyme (muramidase)
MKINNILGHNKDYLIYALGIFLLVITSYNIVRSSNDWLSYVETIRENRVQVNQINNRIYKLRDKKNKLLENSKCLNEQLELYKDNKINSVSNCIVKTNLVLPTKEAQKEEWGNNPELPTQLIENTFSFIRDFEWFRSKAYWDWKQYSVWYWHKAKKWEIITKEESKKEVVRRIKIIQSKISRKRFNDNQTIALTCFIYNTWNYNILKYKKNKDIIYIMSKYTYSNKKKLRGLVKRRHLEVTLFNK